LRPLTPLGTKGNFSDASVRKNDENVLIVRGDRRLADMMFTEYMRLWRHFRFRYTAGKYGGGSGNGNGSSNIGESGATTDASTSSADPMALDGSGKRWWPPFFDQSDARCMQRLAFAGTWCPGDAETEEEEEEAEESITVDESAIDARLERAAQAASRKLRVVDFNGTTGMFELTFAYNRALVALAKELPGRVWDGEKKKWQVPKSSSDALKRFMEANGFGATEAATRGLGGN
jgi:hypothetical protein